ncbi:MAG: ABC transporter ATP-binding protein [Saprospiraceae bacterium]
MPNPIIKVENLSKSYTIHHEGQERYTALRDVVANKTKNIFSFLNKSGQQANSPTNQYANSPTTEEFWALKDINFEINQGDRVGIIGRNGAGKSTLLKVLSRITEPTTGRITLNGRVASLLEVGTGFHPELTGRENIYLNGAILGMSRAEIKSKFDEIVDFAEVEQFLDTPVKRYSSGMYVRLAFAVAAHLEPEILIVDEVLAVGDAQFQKKCLGKMEDVSKNEGRTVLFVSHNVLAIKKLCEKSILLENGKILVTGETDTVLDRYLNFGNNSVKELLLKSAEVDVTLNVKSNDYELTNQLQCGRPMVFIIEIFPKRKINSLRIVMAIYNSHGQRLLDFDTWYQMKSINDVTENCKYIIKWSKNILRPGGYYISLGLYENENYITGWESIENILVLESDYYNTGRLPNSGQGPILTEAEWIIENY